MNNEVNNNIQDVNNALNISNNSQENNVQPNIVAQTNMTSSNVELPKKKGKGKTVFIIILLLLVLGLSGYIAYDKFINKSTNSEVDCTKCNVSDNKDENKTNNDNISSNLNNNDTNDNNKAISNKLINFDSSKCINNDLTNSNYEITRYGFDEINDGLSFTINGRTVSVTARYDIIDPDNYKTAESENTNLSFDKNVEYIFGGVFSNDGNNIILFLMEDGTLEYMKFYDIWKNKKFEHYSIKGISDIVRFDNIIIQDKTKQIGGTTYTSIAYKIDGTFYDLSKFITIN